MDRNMKRMSTWTLVVVIGVAAGVVAVVSRLSLGEPVQEAVRGVVFVGWVAAGVGWLTGRLWGRAARRSR